MSSLDNTSSEATDRLTKGTRIDTEDSQSSDQSLIIAQIAAVVRDMVGQVETAIEEEEPVCAADIVKDIIDDLVAGVINETVDCLLDDMVEQVVVIAEKETEDQAMLEDVVEQLVNKVVEKETMDLKVSSPVTEEHLYAKASSSALHVEQEKTRKGRGVSMYESKRRSTRVKLPASKHGASEKGKETNKIKNHIAELEELLPKPLVELPISEHSYHKISPVAMDTQTDAITDTGSASSCVTTVSFEDEISDVREFLKRNQSNGGVVSTMREWLYELCSKRTYTWSKELISVYVDVYELHRPCYKMPNIFADDPVELDALQTLIWLELKLDLANTFKKPSDHLCRTFEKEFTYWEMIVGNEEKLPSLCVEFSVRYHYLAARYYIAAGHVTDAINVYHNLLNYIESLDGQNLRIGLNNTICKTLLTKNFIERELALLERTKSLDELQTVYDSNDFTKVIALLAPTFESELGKRFSDSRFSQLDLLLGTVEKVANLEDSIKWLTYTLQELVHHADNSRKGNWSKLIIRNLVLLNTRITEMNGKDASAVYVVGIVKACLTIIHVNVSALEAGKNMAVECVLPWILLSKLTEIQESSKVTDSNASNTLAPSLE